MPSASASAALAACCAGLGNETSEFAVKKLDLRSM